MSATISANTTQAAYELLREVALLQPLAVGRGAVQTCQKHKLTVPDSLVLAALARLGGRARPSDLAPEAGLSPSGITRLLAGLEKEALVERVKCDKDARSTHAQLTPEGRLVAESTVVQRTELAAALFAPLSEQQQLDMAEMLRQCRMHLSASNECPAAAALADPA